MQTLREYLLSVTAAAIICTFLQRMMAGKGNGQRFGKMLTGIFMALAVLSPLTEITFDDFGEISSDIRLQAQAAVTDGEESARSEWKSSITNAIEAYILKEAQAMDVSLKVRVALTDGEIPMPYRIYLQGNIAPYAKRKLQNMIQDDLGIDKENQIWT